MKKVKKAVIPAAGLGTRFLPATKAQPKEMLPIVDKPTIQFIIEEAIASGIEEILIITSATKRSIEDHFDKSYELEDTLRKKGKWDLLKIVEEVTNLTDNLHYIRQKEARGLGHAVLCAKTFIRDEPFAILLGDDIVHAKDCEPALKQLIRQYEKVGASIVGVQRVPKEDVSKYGIVEPSIQHPSGGRLHRLVGMVEKPNIEEAPSDLAVLGRYVLTPEIFDMLETQEPGSGGEIQLTDAIRRLMDKQAVYAYEFEGIRYDVGDKFGFVKATIDYALEREDLRDQVASYIKALAEKLG